MSLAEQRTKISRTEIIGAERAQFLELEKNRVQRVDITEIEKKGADIIGHSRRELL